ncbi:MAG: extracellular solute-binding protein [Lachnospiraceae bacterium]|nr:extracellular solute-binding protein [Lachnospiraceae bacterium]
MRDRKLFNRIAVICIFACTVMISCLGGCSGNKSDVITLRVSNWEEYIDEGDWGEDELIELDDGTEIIGRNSLINDFEEWYNETYGVQVKVEYSTFGTNEDLYNQLTIGDVYDLVCPSEYMIMKLMREGMLVPYSSDFRNGNDENNYYENGVSPYIRSVFDDLSIEGEPLSRYAAGYMWGTLGIVYNPDEITKEEASHWNILLNRDYYRRITIKDSVRDAFFAAAGVHFYDEITSEEFINSPDYHEKLSQIINRTDVDTVNSIEDILASAKDNVYSFETDSGKADMVTGKVVANEQWSGDAVYTLNQAEEDGVELCYAVPEECTNLWFDGWVMLKSGIEQDARKQHVAEAFVNYLSKPENAVRNMYYIGYTSVISGDESDIVYDYLNWCYAAGDEEEAEDEEDAGDEDAADVSEDNAQSEEEDELVEYSGIGYFFEADTAEANSKYSLKTTGDQLDRQLFAQYPPKSVLDRAVVMACFDDESNERINRSWTNVRCFDLNSLFGSKRKYE